jgi:hypothetical protein
MVIIRRFYCNGMRCVVVLFSWTLFGIHSAAQKELIELFVEKIWELRHSNCFSV